MKLLFIHRSVGQGIITKGGLRKLLNPSITLDDFNNNTGVLTRHDESVVSGMLQNLGADTKPENLERLFAEWPELLDNYDVVAIKSCYPNSHIKDRQQLEKIKARYEHMVERVGAHGKQLLIVTTPPLRPGFTNKTETAFADELAAWLVAQASDNTLVFDLRHLLAKNGVLRRRFRSWMPWDNHPNRHGYVTSAEAIADTINHRALR